MGAAAQAAARREEEARNESSVPRYESAASGAEDAYRLNLTSYGYTTDYSESGYNVDETSHDGASVDEADVSEDDSFKANTFVAMYNFEPTEDDELRLEEGDTVEDCQFIGEGWLYGVNRRTGESGMLPANYVESINC